MAPGFQSLCACSFLSTGRTVQRRTGTRMTEERVEVLAQGMPPTYFLETCSA